MKTSSLTGAELDYWVAKAIGWTEGRLGTQGRNDPESQGWFGKGAGQYGTHKQYFKPSTNWYQGGKLIEKYSITIIKCKKDDFWQAAINTTCTMDWPEGEYYAEGPTPLIAAMRAIVVSVYGDTVDD